MRPVSDLWCIADIKRLYFFSGCTEASASIRGGTDGLRLSEMGLPCPNIFTRMREIHGPLKWIAEQDKARAANLAPALARRAMI